jgi:SSS family solute:Na+ symporter
MNTNFTALDFVVLVAYLIGTTLLGIWLGRNQKDAKDYFVAGKTIPWWAVLFSVVATETASPSMRAVGPFCLPASKQWPPTHAT